MKRAVVAKLYTIFEYFCIKIFIHFGIYMRHEFKLNRENEKYEQTLILLNCNTFDRIVAGVEAVNFFLPFSTKIIMADFRLFFHSI